MLVTIHLNISYWLLLFSSPSLDLVVIQNTISMFKMSPD